MTLSGDADHLAGIRVRRQVGMCPTQRRERAGPCHRDRIRLRSGVQQALPLFATHAQLFGQILVALGSGDGCG